MNEKVKRVKGMYDLLPEETALWQHVERTCIAQLQAYGYRELRLPLLEKAELFTQAIGSATDVVSKEMYSFEDRNGDVLALRPEGTAGCVRAAIGNGLLQGHAAKLWYQGPMFRRENVQRGRNRQFYQIGAEAFGLPGPDVDAELVLLLHRIFRTLGIRGLRLEVNSLGTPEARAEHRKHLVSYLAERRDQLDEDSIVRLEKNPLRIALERLIVLGFIGGKVNAQLKRSEPDSGNPLGRVLQVYEQNRGIDPESLEMKLGEAILREMPTLSRGLTFLKIIAVVAPLMGLLGTVTGMIKTFQAITLFGTGDPKLMAGGISQALVTTVLGLCVAIPIVLLHAIVSGRSKRVVHVLQEQSAGIIAEQMERQGDGRSKH